VGDNTAIEWCDATWNPVAGCCPVDESCAGCWAERFAAGRLKNHQRYKNLTRDGRWVGVVRCFESELQRPLHWRKPRRIAVGLMGDLFHERVPLPFIKRVLLTAAACQKHRYLFLTKRARRLRDFTAWFLRDAGLDSWPDLLSNVAFGVSAGTPEDLYDRLPHLIQAPVSTRFLSLEPLIRWDRDGIGLAGICPKDWGKGFTPVGDHIDWVIVGGESGPKARPMHPEWVYGIRDECVDAGVSFFFKQWGEWRPVVPHEPFGPPRYFFDTDGRLMEELEGGFESPKVIHRVGKKAAGRLLDGRTWEQVPEGLKI